MIPRYCTAEMSHIWSEENKLRTWVLVEFTQLKCRQAIDDRLVNRLQTKINQLDYKRLQEEAQKIEENVHHDVIAFLMALESQLGEDARFLHHGMTSSDVVDTAFALLLKQAGENLLVCLKSLLTSLEKRALEHRYTICLGRTHGQAAEATTFGLKLLSFVAELKRHLVLLEGAVSHIAYGKLSGAVGTYSNCEPSVETATLHDLGLLVEPVSTQIIPRDRHAYFFSVLAIVGGALERLAVEIRHLMRTEVSEVAEPFGVSQRGSSAMPHKKNPILTENISGLARLLRGYCVSALENQALWHERDISHSSVERVIAPDATQVLAFACKRMQKVVDGLVVNQDKMLEHVKQVGDSIFSQTALLMLVERGMVRSEAYELVQQAALQAFGRKDFLRPVLGEEAYALLTTPQGQLRHVDVIFKRVLG